MELDHFLERFSHVTEQGTRPEGIKIVMASHVAAWDFFILVSDEEWDGSHPRPYKRLHTMSDKECYVGYVLDWDKILTLKSDDQAE